jgi:N-acetylglutamate synthase
MRAEADRVHDGLRVSFADLFERMVGARLEQRAGYRLVVCPSMPYPGLHGIWIDGPDESASREIEGAIAEVEEEAVPAWIEFRAGATPASDAVARRLGFTAEEPIPAMAAGRQDLVRVPGPKGHVTRISEPEGLAVAAAVAAAGFEAPPGSLDGLYAPGVAASPGCSVYLAEVDGVPVSTALSWHVGDGVGIFNVATPPKYRGRGYGRAVTAKAVEDGFDAGADLAWLQASPLGEPVYRAMGFRTVSTYLVLGRPITEE